MVAILKICGFERGQNFVNGLCMERDQWSVTYLIWSFHVRFLVTEPKKSRDSTSVEHPGGETEIVDQSLEAARVRNQHQPSENALLTLGKKTT